MSPFLFSPNLGATSIYNCWSIASATVKNKKRKLDSVMDKDLRKAALTDATRADGVTLSQAVRGNDSVSGVFGEVRPSVTEVLSWETPRIVIYHQHDAPLSTLVGPGGARAVTHVNIGAIHLNDTGVGIWVTLNTNPPDSPRYAALWEEVKTLQVNGVKVIGMLGGAAPGTFTFLDTTDQDKFENYYGPLRDVVDKFKLDGLDLDVEEEMSQAGINRLIDRLKADFHDSFIITLAPVASALSGGSNLSGFSYETLEAERGSKIAWYNGQFYSGYGSMSGRECYDNIVANGFPPSRVVAGVLTSSFYGQSDYVDMDTLRTVLQQLEASYQDFGGVAGWEYFNSDPQPSAPWNWALAIQNILDKSN